MFLYNPSLEFNSQNFENSQNLQYFPSSILEELLHLYTELLAILIAILIFIVWMFIRFTWDWIYLKNLSKPTLDKVVVNKSSIGSFYFFKEGSSNVIPSNLGFDLPNIGSGNFPDDPKNKKNSSKTEDAQSSKFARYQWIILSGVVICLIVGVAWFLYSGIEASDNFPDSSHTSKSTEIPHLNSNYTSPINPLLSGEASIPLSSGNSRAISTSPATPSNFAESFVNVAEPNSQFDALNFFKNLDLSNTSYYPSQFRRPRYIIIHEYVQEHNSSIAEGLRNEIVFLIDALGKDAPEIPSHLRDSKHLKEVFDFLCDYMR